MRDTVEATSVVCSVESTRCPVSAAASAIRIVSGSRISPTTMTSGAWRTRGAERGRKVRRVDADLDLLDDAAVVLVLVLDRILDGDDVARVAAVDLVDERRERRRLAGAGRPADEDQAARQLRQQLDRRRQAERREPRHARRQQPHGGRRAAALAMQVDAEAAEAGDAERRVGDARRRDTAAARAAAAPAAPLPRCRGRRAALRPAG